MSYRDVGRIIRTIGVLLDMPFTVLSVAGVHAVQWTVLTRRVCRVHALVTKVVTVTSRRWGWGRRWAVIFRVFVYPTLIVDFEFFRVYD